MQSKNIGGGGGETWDALGNVGEAWGCARLRPVLVLRVHGPDPNSIFFN